MTDILVLREAKEEDCKLIYEFASDPVVRANSFNSDAIKYEDHVAWFNKKLNSENSFIYILSCGSNQLGQVRIDVDKSEALISYMISDKYRGQGYAGKMLSLLEEKVMPGTVLKAEVKKDNIPSLAVFRKLGYMEADETEKMVFTKQL